MSFALTARAATLSEPVYFQGMCDASAAVALDAEFFAAANDEDNPIRVFTTQKPGLAVQSFDFSRQLRVNPKQPEMDLEGACWLGDKVFWISSHGRNKDGEYRPNRQFLFATACRKTAKGWDLRIAGQPYRNLLADLTRNPRFKSFRLDEASQLAPKSVGGLNIEGLSATPDGKLLIGFRNPIPNSTALLIPLENPEQLIMGNPPKFGEPILLALGRLGIRDIALWENQYLIIAGPADGQGESHLYRWKGPGSQPELFEWSKSVEFNPEAIIVYPDGRGPFQILSDDGTRRIGTKPCKQLKDPKQRRFRSYWVTLTDSK